MSTLKEIVAGAPTLIGDRQGDVSATEIAELFCMSERRSRFYLKKVTGKNLRTLCLEASLAPARPRVRDTNQPIATALRYVNMGKNNGYRFEIWVDINTEITSSVQAAVNAGVLQIVRHRFPVF